MGGNRAIAQQRVGADAKLSGTGLNGAEFTRAGLSGLATAPCIPSSDGVRCERDRQECFRQIGGIRECAVGRARSNDVDRLQIGPSG